MTPLALVPEETAQEHLGNALQVLLSWALLTDDQKLGADGLEVIKAAIYRIKVAQGRIQLEQERLQRAAKGIMV